MNPGKPFLFRTPVVWMWPFVSMFWCIIVIDTWLVAPEITPKDSAVESLQVALESGATAFLVVLMVWMIGSPQPIRHRIAFMGCLVVSSLVLWLLASAVPGDGLNFTADRLPQIFQGHVFDETLNLTSFELGFMVLTALLVFGVLNRQLSQVRLHRHPLPSRSEVSGYFRRLRLAYRSQNETPAGLEDSEARWGTAGLVIWSILLLWSWSLPISVGFSQLMAWSVTFGLSLFLIVWCASLCLWRWWACVVMVFGTMLLATLPWADRILKFGIYWSFDVDTMSAVGSLIVVVCVTVAGMFLMALFHQMPRRFEPRRSANSANDKVRASTVNTPIMQLPIARRNIISWIFASGLWLSFCGMAYWLPRNLDAVVLLEAEPKSIRLAYLSAKLLQLNDGKRTVDFTADYIQFNRNTLGYESQEKARPIVLPNVWEGNGQSHVVTLSQLDERLDQCIPTFRQLFVDKVPVRVDILSPVRDLERLAALLDTGVDVACGLDAGHRPLPIKRLSRPNLEIRSVKSLDSFDQDTWDFIELYNTDRNIYLDDCQLSEQLPVMPPKIFCFVRCQFSPALFRKLANTKHFRNDSYFRIAELVPDQKFNGADLVGFLRNNLLIYATPPFESIVAAPFPAVVIPSRRWGFSSWDPSVRPLLLDSELAELVTEMKIDIPGSLELDSDGQIIALSLIPTRDCPADRKWTIFPHVKWLHLELNPRIEFDGRESIETEYVPEPIDFYPEAFPNLSNLILEISPDDWTDELKMFVRKVLSVPSIRTLEIPLDDMLLWQFAVELSHAETLVIDFSSNRTRALRHHTPERLLEWINDLGKFTKLKKVVIHDPDHMTVGISGTSLPIRNLPQTTGSLALTRAQLTNEWTERILAVAPQIEVRIDDNAIEVLKENDELDD
ncbi:MAG: hypothetical protein Q8M16_10245 [Pirellulaceae bacterium]|nr:hypothetical protein [Pirellulaceae bacterium]